MTFRISGLVRNPSRASRDVVLWVQLEHEVTRPEDVNLGHLLPRPQVFEPSGIAVVRNPEVDRDLCPQLSSEGCSPSELFYYHVLVVIEGQVVDGTQVLGVFVGVHCRVLGEQQLGRRHHSRRLRRYSVPQEYVWQPFGAPRACVVLFAKACFLSAYFTVFTARSASPLERGMPGVM
jgi:hypothetical protein